MNTGTTVRGDPFNPPFVLRFSKDEWRAQGRLVEPRMVPFDRLRVNGKLIFLFLFSISQSTIRNPKFPGAS
jgi:hypothetical protein